MIRLFGLRDVLMIRQLQSQGVAFDLRRLLLHSSSPMRSALAGYLTHYHLGTTTCVHEGAKEGRNLRGFAQVCPRADQAEWNLVFLAPSLERHRNAADLWYRLLTYLTILGAEQGILRIYARSSEDANAEDVFRQAGFTVITREEVFAFPREFAPALRPNGLRPLTPQDGWALDELYRQAMPQLVQQAEGFPSHPGVTRYRQPGSAHHTREYVWVEQDKVIAYIGCCSSPKGHWLEVVARPECRANTLPCIRYILSQVGCSADMPVYCPVPDYDVGLGWLLRTLGFEPYMRQVLLVVHTAARVPVRRQIIVPALERSVNVRTSVGNSCQGIAARKPWVLPARARHVH